MYSPSAEAKALSLVEPLPLVKHMGEWASRMCSDHTLGTRLRQDAISILMPKSAKTRVMLAMVCSSGKSLPGIKVCACASGLSVSKACASASRLSTASTMKVGPAWIAFLTVQRSIDRKMP